MKINYKRSLKFLTLLISALFISTASAAIYNYMYMYATPIGVKGTYDVNFYEGADFSNAGGTITNNRQTVTFTDMKGSNGTLATYSDPVRICNNGTVAHNVGLAFDSWTFSGNAETTLNYVNITLFDYNGGFVGCMSLIPAGGGNQTAGTYSLTSGSNGWWRVQWDILWFGNATTGDSVSITLKITVES
jgi:hypothetical protein